MSHPDFPPHLTDKLPIEKLLDALEFVPNPTGVGFVRRWGIVEFQACQSMCCWFLSRGFIKRSSTPPYDIRVIGWPYEIRLEYEMAPIKMMAIIYPLWADAHRGEEPHDVFLIWGKEWLDYQRELKRLIPPPPTIWADRGFLRHCLTYIEQLHDWVDADYDIRFSQVPGQLRINAKETEIYCPARGNWVGETFVSAKALFRRLPKRFIGHVVMLQIEGDKLRIDTHIFSARWVELNAAANPDRESDQETQ